MTTREEIRELCERTGAEYGVEPLLLLALCERESSYDPSEVRMENGFYRRYVRPMSLPVSTEVLFSASYGLMQIMGEVLFELGYFRTDQFQATAPLVDQFMERSDLQIQYGCKQLVRLRKQLGAGAHTRQVLQRYNGGGNPNYANEVFTIYWRLCHAASCEPVDRPV